MEEKLLKNWLDDSNIYYTSVIYTRCYSKVISITFCQDIDLDSFLDLIRYKSKFNKSRYVILEEDLTILIYGDATDDIIGSIK